MKKLIAITFAICTAPAAFAGNGGGELEELQRKYDAALEQLDDLSSADLSCKAAADCDSLAIGSKACGGPIDYKVVSKLNAHYESGKLQSLAEITVDTGDQINELTGAVSDCMFLMPPNVACDASRCVAQ